MIPDEYRISNTSKYIFVRCSALTVVLILYFAWHGITQHSGSRFGRMANQHHLGIPTREVGETDRAQTIPDGYI